MELRKDLQSEIAAHKRTWEKRYVIYRDLFNDVAAIDYRLKELAHPTPNGNSRLLKAKKNFVGRNGSAWTERKYRLIIQATPQPPIAGIPVLQN